MGLVRMYRVLSGFRFAFHLLEVLPLSVKLRTNDLYLVDGFRSIAEFAWWAETVRVW